MRQRFDYVMVQVVCTYLDDEGGLDGIKNQNAFEIEIKIVIFF